MSEGERAPERDLQEVTQEEPLPQHLEDEVRTAVDRFMEALDSGEKPNREAILAAHRRIAEVLNGRLDAVERLHEAALVAQRAAACMESAPRLRCPHCGHAPAPGVVSPQVLVTCATCGRAFLADRGR